MELVDLHLYMLISAARTSKTDSNEKQIAGGCHGLCSFSGGEYLHINVLNYQKLRLRFSERLHVSLAERWQ